MRPCAGGESEADRLICILNKHPTRTHTHARPVADAFVAPPDGGDDRQTISFCSSATLTLPPTHSRCVKTRKLESLKAVFLRLLVRSAIEFSSAPALATHTKQRFYNNSPTSARAHPQRDQPQHKTNYYHQ